MKILFCGVDGRHSKGAVVLLVADVGDLNKAASIFDGSNTIAQLVDKDGSFKAQVAQIVRLSPQDKVGDGPIFVIGVGKTPSAVDMQKIGGVIAMQLNQARIKEARIYTDFEIKSTSKISSKDVACHVAFGIGMRNYKFDKYYTKKLEERKLSLTEVRICSKAYKDAKSLFEGRFMPVVDGIHFARDLANEVPNVLNPAAFATHCVEQLPRYGLHIKVLNVSEMRELGMGALLGVAQGSANEPKLVVLEWVGADIGHAQYCKCQCDMEEGAAKCAKEEVCCDCSEASGTCSEECCCCNVSLAFVGKGVTFDSGGVNLKPTQALQDMKYDMSGAAVVAGVMLSLAKRKAKVNVVGILGLVENMPSGGAQRPGDVVKSMSGQTVEIDNTDAEGRLVLADAMWYVQEKYNPECIVDVATLTGAITVALGDGYAGLFSNSDVLAQQLLKSGKSSGELVWRFPMSEYYDKQIDSEIADMKNCGAGHGAGSITAAQFLARFVKGKRRWAHLDIAGVACAKSDITFCPKGGTAFGVKLLDEYVSAFCEWRKENGERKMEKDGSDVDGRDV